MPVISPHENSNKINSKVEVLHNETSFSEKKINKENKVQKLVKSFPSFKLEDKENYCNYVNCAEIPKPIVYSAERASVNNVVKKLVDYSNIREKNLYNIAMVMCKRYSAKMKANEKKEKKPELINGEKPVVKISIHGHQIQPHHHMYLKTSHDEKNCRVKVEFVDERYHKFDVALCHLPRDCKGMRGKGKYKGRIANYAYENLYHDVHLNVWNDKKIQDNFGSVDMMVNHMSFSDVPVLHLPFKYWLTDYRSTCDELFNLKVTPETVLNNFRTAENSPAHTFVSKCNHPAFGGSYSYYRTMYISELGKHIKIDHYGKCLFGGRKVSSAKEKAIYKKWFTKLDESVGGVGWKSYCYKMKFHTRYKFSLVFENSHSYGYFTEKLRHALLGQFSIPVYYGDKNIEKFFYHYFPKKYKIFINAISYPDPKDLANYLNYLSGNETAYMEYFQWKFDGYSIAELDDRFDVGEYFNDMGCRIGEFHYFGKRICKLKEEEIRHGKVDRMLIGYR